MDPNRKVRVLQFPLAASKGGITQYVLDLWKNIDRARIHFDFLTFSPVLDFEEGLIDEGCRVYHMSCYPETDCERFSMEFKAVLDNGYDVIELHTSYWKSTIMEVMAKQHGGCKVIVHAHSTGIVADLPHPEMMRAQERHYKIRDMIDGTIADVFLACSKEAADWLYGANVPKEKIVIVKNTIDTRSFMYKEEIRHRIRQGAGLADRYVIGHVGRLEKEKNHEYLLKIFAQLHRNHPDTVLLLVGDGSCRKKIEDQITSLGIGDCVILTGKKDNVPDYLHIMDVFVFPSLIEGFGLSLLEAQCCGLWCIGSTNVPKTAFVTEYAERIPLAAPDRWIHRLEELSGGYDRRSQDTLLREKGYDTPSQIRRLERIYME